MTSRCRWCGTTLPPTGGRPLAWCDTTCTDAHVDLHGTPHPVDAGLTLAVVCDLCDLDGSTHSVPGPVTFPGAWIAAAAASERAIHGHPVDIEATPSRAAVIDIGPDPPVIS